jgi:fibronectin type 3 domain-containing protein
MRKIENGDYGVVATVDAPEWTDAAAEFGRPYTYRVQTLVPLDNNKQAESSLSEETAITAVDTFAPASPGGLRADAAPASIELVWNRSTEPDLAGYHVYRSTAGGAFEALGGLVPTPAYSDRSAEHGKTYRYTISAVDRTGNESERSAPVELAFP